MCNDQCRPLAFLLFLMIASVAVEIGSAAEKPEKIDPRVQGLFDKHLRADPNYAPGDLLTRDLVEPIYNDLISRGIKPSTDPERMYTGILRREHPFVMLLRTPQGRAFRKQLGDKPLVYDRLERLSRLPDGMTWLQQMIGSKQGVELFEQLFSEEGLEKLKLQFAENPIGRSIDLPTGTIYTETELAALLTKVLKTQLDKKSAVAAAKKKSAANPPSATKASSKK